MGKLAYADPTFPTLTAVPPGHPLTASRGSSVVCVSDPPDALPSQPSIAAHLEPVPQHAVICQIGEVLGNVAGCHVVTPYFISSAASILHARLTLAVRSLEPVRPHAECLDQFLE